MKFLVNFTNHKMALYAIKKDNAYLPKDLNKNFDEENIVL